LKIKIVFTYPTKWFRPFAWIIKMRLKTTYSHVAIIVTDPLTEVDEVFQADSRGVGPEELSNFLTHAKIIKTKELELSDSEFKKMMIFIRKNQGRGYSEAGAIAATIPLLRSIGIGMDGDHEFICSEFVVRSLQATGGRLDFRSVRRPFDFVDPLLFERILDSLCRGTDDRCLL
jgi:hypothetical protein